MRVFVLLFFLVNSILGFSQRFEIIDYQNGIENKALDSAGFINYFKDSSEIHLNNAFYVYNKKNEIVYSYFLPIINQIRILKNNLSSYSIFESYLIEVGGKDSLAEILKYNLLLENNSLSIKLDRSYRWNKKFQINMRNVKDKFYLFKNRKEYISKDWASIPDSAQNDLIKLSYDLTFASLNGCKDCIKLMEIYRKTFNFMNFGIVSEKLVHCEQIIRKIKNVP